MLSDGVNLLHGNTHAARKTQELLRKFKWEVWSHSPDSAPNLGSKHLSGTRFSSESDVKTVVENWLYKQGHDFYRARLSEFVLRSDKCRNRFGDYVEKWSDHGGQVVRSRLRSRRVTGSKADSTEDPPCFMACGALNHTLGSKLPPAGAVRKYRGYHPRCHLRRLTVVQNIPRVASEREVNITKLNLPYKLSYTRTKCILLRMHSKWKLGLREIVLREIFLSFFCREDTI
ncbi:hypothetical protein AVEN_38941-1 [Araneus ventricosus]|uniref:Uncharacterized protein n=1 Tax=Araneus ventricosus TaxID=182803 RepID=A0A4Y2NIG3_ARAVE|nr:hypothetical protein AVEN_236538-1 [Araneus ventricosus]GBN39279.1 hypothetical protein AVEN_38941-1 [Araneus ventricosus]